MREGREKERRERRGPRGFARLANRVRDPFATRGKGLFVLETDVVFEPGDAGLRGERHAGL